MVCPAVHNSHVPLVKSLDTKRIGAMQLQIQRQDAEGSNNFLIYGRYGFCWGLYTIRTELGSCYSNQWLTFDLP